MPNEGHRAESALPANVLRHRRPTRQIKPASKHAAPQPAMHTCTPACATISRTLTTTRDGTRASSSLPTRCCAPTASSSQMYCYVLLLSPPMPPQHRGAHRRTTSPTREDHMQTAQNPTFLPRRRSSPSSTRPSKQCGVPLIRKRSMAYSNGHKRSSARICLQAPKSSAAPSTGRSSATAPAKRASVPKASRRSGAHTL